MAVLTQSSFDCVIPSRTKERAVFGAPSSTVADPSLAVVHYLCGKEQI